MNGLTAGTFFKACLIFVFALVDLTFFAAILHKISNIGVYFGMAVFTLLIFATLFSQKIRAVFLSENLKLRICAYIVSAIFSLGVLLAIALSVAILIFACNKPSAQTDTVVVLGCKVNGTAPSLMLSARIDEAYAYLAENPSAICIACGGKGNDEDISEALAIKNALVEKGIDKCRIYLDEESVSTRQNLENAKIIAESNNLSCNIAIATDGFHQMRSQLIASEYGFKSSALSAKTRVYLLPTYLIREWFALCEYFVF